MKQIRWGVLLLVGMLALPAVGCGSFKEVIEDAVEQGIGLSAFERARLDYADAAESYDTFADVVITGRTQSKVTNAEWDEFALLQADVRESSIQLQHYRAKWEATKVQPPEWSITMKKLQADILKVAALAKVAEQRMGGK